MNVFLDTNVVVYAFDRGDRRKQEVAQAILGSAQHNVVVSAQVLNEFYVVVTKKLQPALSSEAAREAVELLARGRVVPVDRELVLEAMDIADADRLSLWDAGIVCAAKRAGCELLYTEDMNDGQTIAGVEVRDPFA